MPTFATLAGASRTRRAILVLILPLVAAVALVAAAVVVVSPGNAATATTIKRWETRLAGLGCNVGRVDGRLDDHARTAVVRFQTRHRLNPSGRFTTTTRNRLMSSTAKRCDVRPVPARTGTGRRIVISQRQDWVWLVRADGSIRAQGGMIDAEWLDKQWYTTGSYCGRPARGNPRTNYSGTQWLYHFVRFAPCGVAFHRVPVSMRTGRQIHPNWYLGTDEKTSDGCIRLSAKMAAEVWDFTKVKTRVRVV